jgi:ribulose-phosphate 3-epimerase
MRRMVSSGGAEHRQIVAADGGIRENTVPVLVASGAQTVVLGSLAFGAPDLGQRIAWLKRLAGH